MNGIEYRKPNEGDISEIVDLLNENVSFGLANYESVKKYIDNKNAVVAVNEGVLVGYICCEKVDSLENEVLGHKDVFEVIRKEIGKKKGELIVIRTFAVAESFRKQGVGSELRRRLLQLYPRDTAFITIGWKGPEGWKSQGIAVKQGFKLIMEKEEYWLEDSLKEGYGCRYCGESCSCSAVIAVKV